MPNVIVVNTPGPQGPTGPQGPAGTSSFDTGSYVTTSSFNALTASVNSLTTQLGFTDSEVNALFIFTSSFNQFTSSYSTGSFTGSFVGSLLGSTTTSSFASTASFVNPLTQSVFISGSATFTFTSGDGLILNRDGAGNHIQPIAQPLVLYSPNSSVYQYINNSGIGINTPPSARFHVKGSGTTSATTTFRVENANASASLLVYDNQTIEVNSTITTNQTYLQLGQGGQIAIRLNGTSQRFVGSSYFENYIQGYVIDTKIKTYSSSTNITFHASDNAELARITNSGSIGIGTTTPSSSLHISGASAILTLTPQHPLPTTNIPTGSFAVSSSIPPKPHFWDGGTWNALY